MLGKLPRYTWRDIKFLAFLEPKVPGAGGRRNLVPVQKSAAAREGWQGLNLRMEEGRYQLSHTGNLPGTGVPQVFILSRSSFLSFRFSSLLCFLSPSLSCSHLAGYVGWGKAEGKEETGAQPGLSKGELESDRE